MGRAKKIPSSELAFVSLFAGAGGLDIGFENAGWTCSYASDIDPVAVTTLLTNAARPGSKFLRNTVVERADVADLNGAGILAQIGKRRGTITALVGGPPCQSWSSAGHQRGFDDPRGRVFRDYVRIAGELDVRWLVFENVRGLLTARGADGVPGSALELIRGELLKAGFQTEVELLNAADYGVPQRRVRLFMIGYRTGDRPPFPEATHSREPDLLSGRSRWVSLGQCLGTLAPLSADELIVPNAKLRRQLAGLTPGTGVKSPGKPEATRPSGHWGYKQGAFLADLGLPARTTTASSQQDWVRDPIRGIRRLCPRECAAIQTFPGRWEFAGSRQDQYRQIGNAVPPLLAQHIAKTLGVHLASSSQQLRPAGELMPLRPRLMAAIRYTMKEEKRNGPSRRAAPSRRRGRSA